MLAGKDTFKTGLVSLMQSMKDYDNSEAAIERFADGLATLCDELIRSGKVSFSEGTVTGIAPPQGGAITLGAATEGEIA